MGSDRQILEHLDPHLGDATPDERSAVVAFVAVERLRFDPDELAAAIRRSLLVHAAGGDLRRELTLDDRAVGGLAADLDRPELRVALDAALHELKEEARGLGGASAALDELIADPDRALRAVAAAVMADELTDEDL